MGLVVVFAQEGARLLGDQNDLAEPLGQLVGDDRLAGEVGDRHRALVVLGDRAHLVEGGLDLSADAGGLGHGVAGGVEHVGVIAHLVSPSPGVVAEILGKARDDRDGR